MLTDMPLEAVSPPPSGPFAPPEPPALPPCPPPDTDESPAEPSVVVPPLPPALPPVLPPAPPASPPLPPLPPALPPVPPLPPVLLPPVPPPALPPDPLPPDPPEPPPPPSPEPPSPPSPDPPPPLEPLPPHWTEPNTAAAPIRAIQRTRRDFKSISAPRKTGSSDERTDNIPVYCRPKAQLLPTSCRALQEAISRRTRPTDMSGAYLKKLCRMYVAAAVSSRRRAFAHSPKVANATTAASRW